MPRLRRSFLRRYRLFAPRLLRRGLLLLALLLLCDGIAALRSPQIQAALSLSTPVAQQNIGMLTAPPMEGSKSVLASDTFRRSDQNSWGISSGGQPWQADAHEAGNFVISRGVGIVRAPSNFACAILGQEVANSEVDFSAGLSSYGSSSLGAILRWSDSENFYKLMLDGTRLALWRVMDGMAIPLQMIAFPVRAGELYTFRFRADGLQLLAMVWPAGQPSPANWQIVLTDSALSTGRAGIGVLVQDGAQARITAFREVAS